jgi:di/tripeptidase
MSFVSFPTDPNIMNNEQLNQLKENYANMIIEGMDMDDLCQMCFDMLMDAYQDCTEDDIKGEVIELYDEEVLESLMPVEEVSQ